MDAVLDSTTDADAQRTRRRSRTTGFNVASSVQVRVYADYGTWQSAAGTQFVTINGLVGGLLWGCSPT